MISDDKHPYYNALDAADAAWATGVVDVSAMMTVVSSTLAKQLLQMAADAGATV